jgi:hypothetical protein
LAFNCKDGIHLAGRISQIKFLESSHIHSRNWQLRNPWLKNAEIKRQTAGQAIKSAVA